MNTVTESLNQQEQRTIHAYRNHAIMNSISPWAAQRLCHRPYLMIVTRLLLVKRMVAIDPSSTCMIVQLNQLMKH